MVVTMLKQSVFPVFIITIFGNYVLSFSIVFVYYIKVIIPEESLMVILGRLDDLYAILIFCVFYFIFLFCQTI